MTMMDSLTYVFIDYSFWITLIRVNNEFRQFKVFFFYVT